MKTLIKLIEKYCRKNTSEFCVDENGNEINSKFTGECESYYPNKKIKKSVFIQKGKVSGILTSYYENGNCQGKYSYENGLKKEEREEFYDNGAIKKRVTSVQKEDNYKYETFYENGNPKALEYKDAKSQYTIGEYKLWYENGRIKETKFFIDRFKNSGDYLQYYEDGRPKTIGRFVNNILQPKDYWDTQNNHILIDGNGLLITKSSDTLSYSNLEYHETYKNYKKNGITKIYDNGILKYERVFLNGEQHGLEKEYYITGSIKKEKLFENGKLIKKTRFNLFKNPVLKINIEFNENENWLKKKNLLLPNKYPTPINTNSLVNIFNHDINLFNDRDQDQILLSTFFLRINHNGIVYKIDFMGSDYGIDNEYLVGIISKLEFEPAIRDSINVKSGLVKKIHLFLEEK